jgi:hypothetical protein
MKLAVPADSKLKIGDRIEIIPSHGCTTSNFYSEFVVHRDGALSVAGRSRAGEASTAYVGFTKRTNSGSGFTPF